MRSKKHDYIFEVSLQECGAYDVKNRILRKIQISENGKARIEVRFENENVWLTQKLMAELFDCSIDKYLSSSKEYL